MKIRKNHAKIALTVQSAVNLRAIVLNFSSVLKEIWEDYNEEMKTTPVPSWHPNNHPVSILFATQISHLTSPGVLDNADRIYYDAYLLCSRVGNEE